MAVDTFAFTTGPATLPDVGILQYNGCTFSPLFETKVSGKMVQDNAGRTVKCTEYVLTADGYVTLPDGATEIGPTMATLATLLQQQGGALQYQGRGFDLIVNVPGGVPLGGATSQVDVAWGPIPELLEFQPLGAGRSAKVKWQVKVTLPVTATNRILFLQLNYETTVSYSEDGYSSLSIRGTMEIPLTRRPDQRTRAIGSTTVDDFRRALENRILSGIDLSRFRVTRREFPVSRDKRTLEFTVEAEEKPYMDLPPSCTIARGSFNVRPAKVGMGLCNWHCTLRMSYAVRADQSRRVAWVSFLALLRLRMGQSQLGNIPAGGVQQNPNAPAPAAGLPAFGDLFGAGVRALNAFQTAQAQANRPTRRAFLIDFSIDEGLCLDSKTTTFSATWKLVTTFSHILEASGLWVKLPERDAQGRSLWAISMRDVQGSQSWLPNRLDPTLDVIVDFGRGTE